MTQNAPEYIETAAELPPEPPYIARLNPEQRTAVVATHNLDLARRMDRMVTLQNGRI